LNGLLTTAPSAGSSKLTFWAGSVAQPLMNAAAEQTAKAAKNWRIDMDSVS